MYVERNQPFNTFFDVVTFEIQKITLSTIQTHNRNVVHLLDPIRSQQEQKYRKSNQAPLVPTGPTTTRCRDSQVEGDPESEFRHTTDGITRKSIHPKNR